MKNSILVLTAICLSMLGMAQEKEWKIAIHVDPNISWMKQDNKNIEQGGNKVKFGFGMMIDKMFTDNYAFGTGINVIRTGGELSYLYAGNALKTAGITPVIARQTRTYNLQYLEVPLTFKLRTNEIGYVTYWAQMGIGVGFNIQAKADFETTYVREYIGVDNPLTAEVDLITDWYPADIKAVSSEDEDIKDDINLFRTSLIVAAGIEYNLSGKTSILAGVTFNNGFSDALNRDGVKLNEAGNPEIYNGKPQTFELKAFNNFVSLNIGVLF